MKKILIIITLFISAFSEMKAQSIPTGMKYQAVARNASGEVLPSKNITLRIELKSAPDKGGKTYYAEEHAITTNQLGLFDLVVGEGKSGLGLFKNVPWSNEDIWMAVSLKEKGISFSAVTESRLLAVPYAFHAATAGRLIGDMNAKLAGNDPGTPSNVWSLQGNTKSNASKDRLGTADYVDLVIVTNNLERMKIAANGNININNSLNIDKNLSVANDLSVGKDLTVTKNINLNTTGGATNVNGALTVNQASPTVLSGTLNAQQAVDFDASLNVDGNSTLNTLSVTGPTTFDKNLKVGGTLSVDGATTLNSDLTVANSAKTTLTGNFKAMENAYVDKSFEVGGRTILFGELIATQPSTLHGLIVESFTTEHKTPFHAHSSVDIDGSLNVDGPSTLKSLTVTGPTNYSYLKVKDSLTVDGITKINGLSAFYNNVFIEKGYLNVRENALIDGNLQVKKTAFLHKGFQTSGSSIISSDTDGPDYAWGSYPLQVEGSNQGIWITVDGAATEANNFVTFASHDGGIKGCIEGQTLDEKKNSFDYIWANFMLAFDIAQPAAEAIACALNVPTDLGEIASNGAAAAVASDNLATWNSIENNNAGVAFVSGNGDYAEWLPKGDKNEIFSYGDILGVNGGNISKVTKGAANYMVVSKAPIVLGNMPPSEAEKKDYEKVAFMGQVPVKVMGAVEIGDYILPSGKNDGFGYAVHPSQMSAKQYREIVGVAWSKSSGQSGFSYINAAIGISQHVIADKLELMQSETEKLKKEVAAINSKMDQVMAALEGKKINVNIMNQSTSLPSENSVFTNTNQEVKLANPINDIKTNNENIASITSLQAKIKEILDAQNINYNRFEQTRKMVTDPNYFIEMQKVGAFKAKIQDKK